MPVSLFTGEEAYLQNQALRALREKYANPAMAGLGHQIIIKPGVQELADLLGATSLGLLMGGTTLVEVHDFEPLSKAFDASEEKSIESLKEILLSIVVDETPKHVVFVSRKSNKTLKFTKWLTTDKTLKLDLKEFKPLAFWETDKAVQFLMQEAQRKNIKLQPQAATLLAEQMGVDLQVLVNELEKLGVYAADKPITVETVKLLSNHNENVFAMVEEWFKDGNRTTIYSTLDEILLRKHPVELFALIQTRLNNVFQLRHWERMGLSQAEMASRGKKHPFVIKKDLQAFGRIPYERLQALREKTTQYEWQSKNGSLNARVALEMLLGA